MHHDDLVPKCQTGKVRGEEGRQDGKPCCVWEELRCHELGLADADKHTERRPAIRRQLGGATAEVRLHF